MLMSKIVSVAGRFQRSINIIADQGDIKALDGFICPKSSSDTLINMCRNISDSGQAAYTWTGPYGSGKSSLALLFNSVLGKKGSLRTKASGILGKSISNNLWKYLPTGSEGWQSLLVIGSRQDPRVSISSAFSKQKYGSKYDQNRLSESEYLIESLLDVANKTPKKFGGLVLFIDEMGKFLEGAAQNNSDIYFFQQLAEAASRSNGRLIVIGVLHQSFDEYARRLSREMRDEWSKVQGRFVDLPINAANEEQLDLISRAIVTKSTPKSYLKISNLVASEIQKNKQGTSKHIGTILSNCWPLHPATAALLGPLSRRRFGQNQRSLFGFLSSAEPGGFQDFIINTDADSDILYTPDLLWNYLKSNLESSILASPDSHRWAISSEAISRTEASGGTDVHMKLIKIIAALDFLKDYSSVYASPEVLRSFFPDIPTKKIDGALSDLEKWSSVIFKKHIKCYGIFAGSDFDLEGALTKALNDQNETDLSWRNRDSYGVQVSTGNQDHSCAH